MRIAIVGSGISGSTLAINLARRGVKVDLYEMREKPKGICGGGLGFYALDRIRKMDDEIYELLLKSTRSYITSFKVYTRKNTRQGIDLSNQISVDDFESLEITGENLRIKREKLGIIMDRHVLDEEAVKIAISYGVQYYNRMRVNPYELNGYDYVVDARGVDGWAMDENTFLVAYQEYYPTPKERGNVMEIYFDNSVFNMGYSWFMPRGGEVKVGFGDVVDKVKREGLKNYMNYTKIVTKTEDKLLSFEGAQLPLSGKVVLRKGKVYKVGTSAGFIDPLTGGGIRMGIESAIILSRALLSSNPYLYYLLKTAYLRGQVLLSRLARDKLVRMSNEEMTRTLLRLREKISGKKVTDSVYLEVIRLIPQLFV